MEEGWMNKKNFRLVYNRGDVTACSSSSPCRVNAPTFSNGDGQA